VVTGIPIPVLKQHTPAELAHITYEAHRLGKLLAGGADDRPGDPPTEGNAR
jgi:hypothetical protein